ncbi:MAG TPA: plastocyanin/azurin family copper-binding protein [Symbiobacteriaceae bacterium]|jgi:plastocyanin
MRKRILLGLSLVALLAGCGSKPPVEEFKLTGGGTQVAVAPVAVAAGTEVVAMKNMKFDPPTLEVKAGTTVLFRNDDPFEHSVWEGIPEKLGSYTPLFQSDTLKTGGQYSFKFDKPGTYQIFCNTAGHFLLGMKAQINVK